MSEQSSEKKVYKYAELYCGKVKCIQESYLEYVDFCSIYSPSIFWVDVTGIEGIDVGWVVNVDSTRGTYFEKPDVLEENKSLFFLKNAKLELLSRDFNSIQDSAYITSSLGFRANAGQRAYRDIDGLITQMSEEQLESVDFRDYDNVFQQVTFEELKILKLEIIKNGQHLYLQKWNIEQAINEAESEETLHNISIKFDMLDFFAIKYNNQISYKKDRRTT